ncbi:FUSC family protein [Roseomonas marmotae]|uniref:FUSC family protein n=1 Tax=Roseomonas marmotae TaxID=2768161 RepID=A0ABS3KAR1_9PROT|nr:FUSC family protein [Roseomonas marmotae]MBO1074543.1 FUSC family protein [Roseomonas marmotae]QTI81576.1 FUSC family protein [Roseomonas marmotae]
MNPAHWLSWHAIDRQRLGFCLRVVLAACLALLLAWMIGLEHPQWSAMTVFAASQPARNMLVEKSFFRAAGTLLGTAVGVLIVFLSGGEPVWLVAGLSVWLGACAWLGNVLRGLVAYGTLLAGYSATMVAMLDTAHPGQLWALGADRLLTVMTGVLVALLVGLLFTPRQKDPVPDQARRLTATMLRHLAGRMRGDGDRLREEQHALLREMALIDEALDPHGAGSLRLRKSARTLRALISAQVSALLWLRGAGDIPPSPEVAGALEAAASKLEASAPATEVIAALERAEALAAGQPALREAILRIEFALRERFGMAGREAGPADLRHPPALHRDWVGATHASIRATSVMLLLGAIWVVTGWSAGPYLLLGTSVMATLFSTWENPAWIMRQVLVGQVCGGVAALACRWLVWPMAGSGLELVLMLMPFLLLGVLPLAHRRMMFGATDYFMALLLLSQPSYPLGGTFPQSVSLVLAVLAGPLIALVAFRVILPADAGRRMAMLMKAMIGELQSMAASPDAARRKAVWRARLNHRLLRLVRWSEKSGVRSFAPDDGALAVLAVGSAVLRMQEIRARAPLSPGLGRAIDTALRRVEEISSRPERVPAALDMAAGRIEEQAPDEARVLRAAGAALRANLAFFRHPAIG